MKARSYLHAIQQSDQFGVEMSGFRTFQHPKPMKIILFDNFWNPSHLATEHIEVFDHDNDPVHAQVSFPVHKLKDLLHVIGL